MVKKMRTKATELNQPVKLFLDPIKPVIEKWAATKAAGIIDGWDKIEGRNFYKTFFPNKL